MKNLILLGIATLTLNPAVALAATDAEIVTEMATKCWTLPEGVDYQRASATFEVTYNSDGELLRVVTVDYQPVRKAGEEFAVSAQQALMECASKTSVKSRTVRVVMRFTASQSNGPLIMKKPLR